MLCHGKIAQLSEMLQWLTSLRDPMWPRLRCPDEEWWHQLIHLPDSWCCSCPAVSWPSAVICQLTSQLSACHQLLITRQPTLQLARTMSTDPLLSVAQRLKIKPQILGKTKSLNNFWKVMNYLSLWRTRKEGHSKIKCDVKLTLTDMTEDISSCKLRYFITF